MRNKILTYVLMGMAILVWGIIAVKFFSRENSLQPVLHVPQQTAESGKNIPQIQLKLDYKDPFLKNIVLEEPNLNTAVNNVSADEVYDIKCYGKFIKGKRIYYPLTINGIHYTLMTGDFADGLYLSCAKHDSLYFTKGTRTYSVNYK